MYTLVAFDAATEVHGAMMPFNSGHALHFANHAAMATHVRRAQSRHQLRRLNYHATQRALPRMRMPMHPAKSSCAHQLVQLVGVAPSTYHDDATPQLA